MSSVEWVPFVTIPVIAAIIGWLTNVIAVRMLFHPRTPRRFLFVTFHGVFPRRRAAVIERLTELVTSQLLSAGDLQAIVRDAARSPHLLGSIRVRMIDLLTIKLPDVLPMLSVFIGPEMITSVVDAFMPNLSDFLDDLAAAELPEVLNQSRLQSIVAARLNAFSDERLEAILLALMQKEFRFIEFVGAILGFFIGVIQSLLALFL